jgi:hypothetical protein
MSNKRILRLIRTFFIVLLIVAVAVGAYMYVSRDTHDSKAHPTTVTPDGGRYIFPSGIVLTVPKGAVAADTELSVSVATILENNQPGPFVGMRTGAVMFDISLIRNDQIIQPLAPLGIEIPLKGALLPGGATPSQALLYTGMPGGSFQFVPGVVGADATLRGSLAHLSPKYLVYVNHDALLNSFFPKKIEADRDECKQEVTVAGQKVTISDGSRGWSNRDESPIFACLLVGKNDAVQIGVANRVDYILSVAATRNLRLETSSGSVDDDITMSVAKLLPLGDKIRAYLPRDGKIVAEVEAGKLPATIELKGDFRTFAAESIIRVLGLAVGILTGTGNAGQSIEMIGKLLDAADVLSCAKAAVDTLARDVDFGTIVNAAASCLMPLISAVGSIVSLSKLVERIALMVAAIKAIIETIVSAVAGVRLALIDVLRVKAVASVPACPTSDEVVTAVVSYDYVVRGHVRPVKVVEVDLRSMHCGDGWALPSVVSNFSDDLQPGRNVGPYGVLVHWEEGRWVVIDYSLNLGKPGSPSCASRVPRAIRTRLTCP